MLHEAPGLTRGCCISLSEFHEGDGPVGVGTAPPVQFAVSSTSTVDSVLTSESGTNRVSYVRTGPGGIGPVGG